MVSDLLTNQDKNARITELVPYLPVVEFQGMIDHQSCHGTIHKLCHPCYRILDSPSYLPIVDGQGTSQLEWTERTELKILVTLQCQTIRNMSR